MQHLKPAIWPLTAQGDLIKNKGRGQCGKMVLRFFSPNRDLFVGQLTCEGQVELERFHHVWITPLRQKCVLHRGQARLAAARQFGVTGWCAERIKLANTGARDPLQRPKIATRRQRQKVAQSRQIQALATGSSKRGRQGRCGDFQILKPRALFQPERRFQRSVQPIFLRCHRDVTQTGQIRLGDVTASGNIPAEPCGPRLRQGPLGRNIINCKSSV